MSEGVDVANHQGSIDWGAARTGGIEFAYIKVTEGVGYVDPRVDAHLTGARNGGVLPGLYHFARPDTNAPEADAEHFANQLGIRGMAQPGALPPCLDLEQDAPVNMIAWTQRFIATLRALTGHELVTIYANTSWWFNQLGGGAWMDEAMFGWTAHYGPAPGNPGFRSERTVIHQYTDAGRIPGYGDDIDRDVCWVDLASLSQGDVPIAPAPIVVDDRPDGWVTVRPGDTLSAIGARLGIAWQDLAAWNSLPDADHIVPDQRLRTTPPEGGGAGGGLYEVQPGDSLSSIAAAHGVSWQDIYNLNRGLIANPDVIQAGWRLAMPGTGGGEGRAEIYTVQSGDTLSSIAAEQGVTGGWQALYDANRDTLSDPDVIYAGRQIRIPR